MLSFFPSRAVFLEVGGFSVHWYGIMYLCAFILAFFLVQRLQRHRDMNLSSDEWASILSWAIIGVLVGGRIGYVLFYEPIHFLTRPWEIFAVWQGGMSSHGGFIGVCVALLWALRKVNVSIMALADIVVVPIAIGLALGRLGNFINLELYGSATSLPWGIAIPGVEGLRHPTQLYAIAKDLLIAGVCFWHLTRTPFIAGRTCALFLILYGILRFLIEFLRVQQYSFLDIGVMQLSRGQLLTIPVIIAGVLLWQWSAKQSR